MSNPNDVNAAMNINVCNKLLEVLNAPMFNYDDAIELSIKIHIAEREGLILDNRTDKLWGKLTNKISKVDTITKGD